jgi:hypothetical protein
MRLLVKVFLKNGGASWSALAIEKKRTLFAPGTIGYELDGGGYYRQARYLGQTGILIRSETYQPHFCFVSDILDRAGEVLRFTVPDTLSRDREEVTNLHCLPLPIAEKDGRHVEVIYNGCSSIFLLEKKKTNWTLSSFSAKIGEEPENTELSYVSVILKKEKEFSLDDAKELAAARSLGEVQPQSSFAVFADLQYNPF